MDENKNIVTIPQKSGFNWMYAEFLAVTLIMVVGAGILLHKPVKAVADTPPKAPQGISVRTAPVTRTDMPEYLEGLGNVQAFNTVTITARVDGQIQSINFTEGQEVKKGDLLAQIDPRPYQASLDLASATKAKDEAQLENARRDLKRYQILQPKNLTSKQTLDTQKSLVDQLEAQVKADQANIDSAKTQLDYTSIKSPIDGQTGIRQVDVGNNVHGTDTTGIVVVTQTHPISAIFTLPEDALPQIHAAMGNGAVGVTALAQDDKTELDTGTLLLIDNQINQSTGTVRLKATFPNDKNTLWPGQFINARLLLQIQQKVLSIPSTAAQRGPDGMFAYVVKPENNTVEARPLKTGIESNGVIVVEGGLKEGEEVVITNQYRLQPGSTVKVANDDKNPAIPDAKDQKNPK
jgi:multidrug efflux system membrane fusion protein